MRVDEMVGNIYQALIAGAAVGSLCVSFSYMLPALVRKPYFGIVMRWLVFLWVFTMGMLWLSTVPRTGSPWSPEYRQQLVMCTAGFVP